MSSSPYRPRLDGRIVICDYNALLLSVTGLLRMAGYCVFQAYDGHAAEELCGGLPNISLLILNTTGTGIDLGELIQEVRERIPGLPVLHIGPSAPLGIPADVPTISEDFTPDHLLTTVGSLIQQRA
jgi:hypothetical protein